MPKEDKTIENFPCWLHVLTPKNKSEVLSLSGQNQVQAGVSSLLACATLSSESTY
jgi:hypothetical protein